jgi:ABC-type transport system substrate-binding protein
MLAVNKGNAFREADLDLNVNMASNNWAALPIMQHLRRGAEPGMHRFLPDRAAKAPTATPKTAGLRLQSIVPDLATSWSWSEDGTELTFPLRQGVTWHDGKPLTAKDVVYAWDLLTGKSNEKLRVNPHKSWYRNLERVTTNGDYGVTFHLKRPQPAFITALASGYSPIYPCHVSPREMRQHPVGTGPFKFGAFNILK